MVAQSYTEAEYKALAYVSIELTWVVSLLRELGVSLLPTQRLWFDNIVATYLCVNHVFHAREKHVEIDYHFIRDKMTTGELIINFIFTNDQLADIFTKLLLAPRFAFLCDKLQVSSHDLPLEG